MAKRSTKEEFIQKAKLVHGDKYDYSLVNYVNVCTKVKIICPKHGIFEQTPAGHLDGNGCVACSYELRISKKRCTTEEFIKRAKEVHGDKYDYSKVEYINRHTKVCIICPIHGEFWQSPNVHLKGCECPACSKIKVSMKKLSNTKEFIQKAKNIHGDLYDYSNVEYVDSKTKVCIICHKHGEFWQRPNDHLNGVGCPYCSESHGEKRIRYILNDMGIEFKEQHMITLEKKLFSRNNIKVDFYIQKLNTIIEFNGRQHYQYIQFFHKSEDDFQKQVERDERLKEYCKDNGINLIVIKYSKIDEIDKLIDESLCKILKSKYVNICLEVAKDFLSLDQLEQFEKEINVKFREL